MVPRPTTATVDSGDEEEGAEWDRGVAIAGLQE
jgi:hypothetical protein